MRCGNLPRITLALAAVLCQCEPQQETEPENIAAPPAGEASIGMTMAPDQSGQGATVVDILALEHQPGVSPALPQVSVPPGPAYPGLSGAPGPSPAMGPNAAPVKVFLFSDFQCPVCRRVVEPLKYLARKYPDDVQIVFKNNALESHSRAAGAAAAAIAAFRQGKFWEYHDLLFTDQSLLAAPDLIRHAEELGLDVARFQSDMNDPAAAAQVTYESAMAQKLGARGTPGFFINGEKIAGWGSYSGMEAAVKRALAAARRLAGASAPDEKIAEMAT